MQGTPFRARAHGLLADHVNRDGLACAERVVAVRVGRGVIGLVDEDGDVEVVVDAPTGAQREVVTVALVRQRRVWSIVCGRGADLPAHDVRMCL